MELTKFYGILRYNRSPYPRQTTRPSDNYLKKKEKKRTCRIVDFAIPADHRIKIKENEKRDKFFDLGREVKKLWSMKLTVIPIVIGALGTIPKDLVRGWKT